ncbi:EFR1 family ferrodoxin [Faecalicatena acetigenes]|jgi:ferredoxin|uniref:EFR1 family ferrodoxin n=1 Tax=Faecalicatena acetigenes TaxID=2981790 RepID=A0ABT2TBC9_9FIRM|nr:MULTISPECIES: EFR1 family ferrodoxin [Lachnospiraceae]MCU6747291.1 EFR1 family ferrodoxin [Faecalicatena acetigenes]SCH78060.1 NADH-plastoquinone oxidoreductase subunit [uncultured Clostridium sp.]
MIIFYFSGTGNTLWAAKKIAHRLSGECHGIMEYAAEKSVEIKDDRIGFVFPVYMNDIPWVVKAFLMEISLHNPKYIFAVLTSSSGKHGKAVKNLEKVLQWKNASLSAVFDLAMPGNCMPGNVSKDTEKLEKAPEKVEQIIKAIRANTRNVKQKLKENKISGKISRASAGSLSADFVTSSWFYGQGMAGAAMKPYPNTEKCTGCRICEKVCPTGNIQIRDRKAVHGGCCAACYACYHWCPEQAYTISMPVLRGRKQYHHPDISWEDIAEQKRNVKEGKR